MSEDEQRPYAGPGRETTRRPGMPDDHDDVKEYVETVDEEVPEEPLQSRVADTLEEPGEQRDD